MLKSPHLHFRKRRLTCTKAVALLLLYLSNSGGVLLAALGITILMQFRRALLRTLELGLESALSGAGAACAFSIALVILIGWNKSRPFRLFCTDLFIALLLLIGVFLEAYAFNFFKSSPSVVGPLVGGAVILAWALFHIFIEIVWIPPGRFRRLHSA